MKILIAGWFGAGNMGDEAILISELLIMRQHIKDADFYIISFNAERTRRLTREIPEVKKILRMGSKKGVVQSQFLEILKTFLKVDLVVIGGGGLFQDIYNHYPIPFFTSLALLARICMKKTMLYSVGIGPVNSLIGRKLVRIAANLSGIISVRDPESRELLQELGVSKPIHVAADPVFLLSPEKSYKVREIIRFYRINNNKGPVIGVCIQDLLSWHDDNRRILADIFDILISENCARIIFIPFGIYRDSWLDRNADPVDVAASKRLAGFMKEKSSIITEEMAPEELLALMGSFNLVISMRLHGVIMGLSMATPVVALTYQKESKISDLMNRVGQAESLFDICSLNKEQLLNRIRHLLPERNNIREQLEKAV